MTPDIDIMVDSDAWSAVEDLPSVVRRSIEAAVETGGFDWPKGAELSVLFCDDAAIRVLNRTWRGIDKPTNVLSFPAGEPAQDGAGLPHQPSGPRLLGDIAVAFETTRREAEHDGKPLADHLSHLLVHGFLHLLDHDHENEADASLMETLETSILARLGIADPYAGSDPVEAVPQ